MQQIIEYQIKNTPVIATIMDPIPLAHPEWVSG